MHNAVMHLRCDMCRHTTLDASCLQTWMHYELTQSSVLHVNIPMPVLCLRQIPEHPILLLEAMDWWPPPPPPPVRPVATQTSSSASITDAAKLQAHKRDGKWRRTVIEQTRTAAIAAITGGLPRAYGEKRLVPHIYVPLRVLPNATASDSAAASSSAHNVALDNELTSLGGLHDESFTEALPQCYQSDMAQIVAKQPYKRPRIFKKYPGKNKPPPSKKEVVNK